MEPLHNCIPESTAKESAKLVSFLAFIFLHLDIFEVSNFIDLSSFLEVMYAYS